MCKQAAQLLRSAACLHTNQSRTYLNHLVHMCIKQNVHLVGVVEEMPNI